MEITSGLWKYIVTVGLVLILQTSCVNNPDDSSGIDQEQNIQTSTPNLQQLLDSISITLDKTTEVYVYCACLNAPTIFDSTDLIRPICISGRITEDDLISGSRPSIIDTLVDEKINDFKRIIEQSSKSIYTNPLPVKEHVNLLFTLRDKAGNYITVRYQDNSTLVFNNAVRLDGEDEYYLKLRDLLTKKGREIYDNGCRWE